ncbi:MAG: bifunctional riboflavin kinase/FAD synthetase [Desulfatirhabdiaceae bacterium]|nr:bifunctional riboflavin kinase/FAD synthetase [Desulfatirhabdiaceae bacterium]
MEFIKSLNHIDRPFNNAVITIGNFDGVHIGHQALFHEVIEKAEEIGGTSIAMTFDPHPLRVLNHNKTLSLITRSEHKLELISASGIDVLICIPFTREFAAMSARAFVEQLVKRVGMKAIVTGNDYTFGRNREGNVDLLKSLGQEMGFEVLISDWIQTSLVKPVRISSTRIRELIAKGKVGAAKKLLGRFYQVRGTVVTGRNRGGKLLGFPTANLVLQDELCPKAGVYAVTVECLDRQFMGVANIGYSPTFSDNIFTVEVHILDFHNDIYGKNIRVNFIERIRDEIKFSGISELSEQIRKDIEYARGVLSQLV